ncbi:hypothetical protein GGH12_002317 [Coemansia sp. RSA 1822]|nr:hypothetical protein GGH12_002317 [Coemansia sp. RSA 1822]
MKTICTVGAIAAMLISACAGQDTSDRVDRAVAEARAMRHEQCDRLDHTALEYNQCMARWTDRVLECFPEKLTVRQEADKMTELGRADAYHNAVERQLHAAEHRRNAWTGASNEYVPEDNVSEERGEASFQRVQQDNMHEHAKSRVARGAGKQAPVRQATVPMGNTEIVDSGDQANAASVAMPITAEVPQTVIHQQSPQPAEPEKSSNVPNNMGISQSVQPGAGVPPPTAANMVQAQSAVNATAAETEAKHMASSLASAVAQSVGQAVSATAGTAGLLSLATAASTASAAQQLDVTTATVTVTTPVQMAADASQVFPIQTFIAQTVVSPSPVAQSSAAKESVQTTVAQALVSQSSVSQASAAKETIVQASVVQASVAQTLVSQSPVAKESVAQASVVQESVSQAPGVQTLATQTSVIQASVSPTPAVQKSMASSQDQPLTTMVAAEIEVPQLVTIKVVTHTIEAAPTMVNSIHSIHMTTFGNAVVPWDVNLFGTESAAVGLSAEASSLEESAEASAQDTSVTAESVTFNSESGVVAESVTFNAESVSDARSVSSESVQAVSATAPAALSHAQAMQSPVDAVRALGVVDATEAAAKIARASMKNKETNASTKMTISTAAVIVPVIAHFFF